MPRKVALARVALIFSIILAVLTTVGLVLSAALLLDMSELSAIEDKEAADGIGLAALIVIGLVVLVALAIVTILAAVFFVLGLVSRVGYAKIAGICTFAYSIGTFLLSIIAFMVIT